MPRTFRSGAPVFRDEPSRGLLPAKHEAQNADEQVGPVHKDRPRDVDRVVERARHAHRLVPVVDDHPREERHARPVEPGECTADVEAEHACDRDDEVAGDQGQQAAEQPGPPALEALGDQRADDAEHGDQQGGDEQRLGHVGVLVLREHRSEHQSERYRDQCVAEQRDQRVVTLVTYHRTDDGDHEDPQEERRQRPVGAEREVPRELCSHQAGDNPRERECRHGAGELAFAHRVVLFADAFEAIPYIGRETHEARHS